MLVVHLLWELMKIDADITQHFAATFGLVFDNLIRYAQQSGQDHLRLFSLLWMRIGIRLKHSAFCPSCKVVCIRKRTEAFTITSNEDDKMGYQACR